MVSTRNCRTGVILDLVDGNLVRHVAWMRQRGLSASTIRGRTDVVRLLLKHAQKPLSEITEDDLRSWQSTLGLLASNSRHSYISHLRQVFGWLHHEGLIGVDPSTVLVLPRMSRGLPRPISEAKLELALSQAPLMLRCCLELAGYAGLRAGEIALLERSDIADDAVEPYLYVRGKGGRGRTVPLSPVPLASLIEYGLPLRGRIFRRHSGAPMTPRDISRRANAYLHGLGLPETLHQLRHRFGTQALQHSHDLREVQELLGHASPATTAVYTLVDPSRLAATVTAIDRPLLRPVQDSAS